ncbi:MAG: dynamin family protein [Deltaproteobacteria bacterium]|nr:dynamin family protein [Deltaproteobacteria bacterium]MBW2136020.1 dynamin family protein [Deltaproteobacteria bacterium]
MVKESKVERQLERLQEHLKQENPILSEVVSSFRELDRICRKLGFFSPEESHATRTAWWPLISVLGVYSSGKSTFINHYLAYRLQATGTQAVDDRFTVICYGRDDDPRVLPGVALDADPRFPLYRISRAIESVAEGEGRRIDSYLQLKTCGSERIKGKIFIDSPGFDADAQRTSTLRITDHIIDISDLVLIFFDARHPETGSMQNTLEHLVRGTIHRTDSNKFLYILNQIDTAAREDNPEEVFSAWQRALAQYGMTAGRYYTIYNEEAAIPIKEEKIRARFESKRDADLREIHSRIEQVGVERAYRIVGMLEQAARSLKQDLVPFLKEFMGSWRRRVLMIDGVMGGLILICFLLLTIWQGYWEGLHLRAPFLETLVSKAYIRDPFLIVIVLLALGVHQIVRRRVALKLISKSLKGIVGENRRSHYLGALEKNCRWTRSIFQVNPEGWGRRNRRRLEGVLDEANTFMQRLNDMYTDPSGEGKGGPLMGEPPLPRDGESDRAFHG